MVQPNPTSLLQDLAYESNVMFDSDTISEFAIAKITRSAKKLIAEDRVDDFLNCLQSYS